MKKIIGTLLVICSTALIAIIVMRIWGLEVVSTTTILKSGATLGSLAALCIILIIFYGLFFRDHKKGYGRRQGQGRSRRKL